MTVNTSLNSPDDVGNVRKKNVAIILDAAKKEFVTFGFKGASIKRIAERAHIPRANIHYYFANKDELYKVVLTDIVTTWNKNFDSFTDCDDPKVALSSYIRSKVKYSMEDPEGSRIFASEIIHGADALESYLSSDFTLWLEQKVKVIKTWIKNGLMDDINPYHLLFLIWGATQHYADFNVQVVAALNVEQLNEEHFESIVQSITHIVLKGCGISSN